MNSAFRVTLLLIFSICCVSFRTHASIKKAFSVKVGSSFSIQAINNKDALDSSELEFGSSTRSSSQLSVSPLISTTFSSKTNSDDGLWKIDLDSAEIEVGSSSAAQRKALEPSLTKPVPPSAPKSNQGSSNPIALSSSEATGFDYGLLVAFPVMIGTLGFFFLFPFIGETLSQGVEINN